MNFSAWHFFWAGLACAAVPIIIHLLNRRRYRVVKWAAMDFLREALQRNRRIMQMRDLILMALRTAAVLLFGVALAQPFFVSQSEEQYDRSRPLHAVLVVDNSMSMGYEEGLDNTLLDKAKGRAEEFIKQLPSGSRITVVPLCGSPGSYSFDPYRTASDAIDAVGQIEPVHRSGSLAGAADLAVKASQSEVGAKQSKRIVFFSDQQLANWRGSLSGEHLKELPAMQLVDVSPAAPTNSWIEDIRLEDGVADVETPANFAVRIRHQGPQARKDVQVSLSVDGEVVAVKTVTLEPGSAAQEIPFKHQFDTFAPEPGQPAYVPVKASIAADDQDRLADDNQRYLVVPVVAALPVVFIDQLGESGERPSLNRYGETRQLRRLLVPVFNREDPGRNVVKIEHVTIDDVDEDLLSDARLVVVAGVADPGVKVQLLRQYVQQGGQLLIAAGGDFKPSAWTASAWLDGEGILPVPLQSQLHGTLPEEDAGAFDWFELSYDDTMKGHSWFRLAGVDDNDLKGLYGSAFFFQAAVGEEVDESELLEAEAQRLDEQFAFIAEAKKRLDRFVELEAKGELDEKQRAQRASDQNRLDEIIPAWLAWSAGGRHDVLDEPLPEEDGPRQKKLEEFARRTLPETIARFDNGMPFLVERRIGQGRVVLCTSGIMPEWNTVSQSNAMLLFDQVLRGMLQSTIAPRTFAAQDQITLPLGSDAGGWTFQLQRPAVAGREPVAEELLAGYIGPSVRGLTIDNALYQGIYRVTAYRGGQSSDPNIGREKIWETPMAVNVYAPGAASESEMQPMTSEQFNERVAGQDVKLSWVGSGDTISLAGSTIRGQNTWLYLILAVLLLLFVEIAMLAWPAVKASRAPAESN